MTFKTLTTFGFAGLLCAACGDDGGSSTKTVEDQQTIESGKATATQSAALGDIPEGSDSAGAQGPIQMVGSSLQAWAGRHQQVSAMQQASALTVGQLEQAQAAGGEVSYVDGHLSADIEWSQNTGLGNSNLHYKVELDLADTSEGGRTVDGTFDLAFTTMTPQYDVAYSYNAVYEALTTDAAGCAIGGSIALEYSLSLGGETFDNLPAEARAQVEAGAGAGGVLNATFGPNCGDVAMEGS